MLFTDIGPVYLRFGLLLNKTASISNEININKHKFEYIYPQLLIDYNDKLFLFLRINYFRITHFKDSYDYLFIKEKLNSLVDKQSYEDQEVIETRLKNHKDSITILSSPRATTNHLPVCYYSGHITGKSEALIYELFQMKCVKGGKLNQVAIYGIDFITEYIENSFFTLPKTSVGKLIRVGKGLDKVEEKYPLSLKGKLYPYLMSNTLEGVSIYRVDGIDSMTRLGGNTFGATTFWSLVTLSCGYKDPEEAVSDAIIGDNQLIDLSVGDIYGGNYSAFSLDSDLIASSFSKLKYVDDIKQVDKKDIARSLITLLSTNISQITGLLAKGSNIDKVILLGNPFSNLLYMQMVQTCTDFFSEDRVKSIFSDYSQFFEIIGMWAKLDKERLEEELCFK